MKVHRNKKVFVVLTVVVAVHENKALTLVVHFTKVICNFVNAREIVRHHHTGKIMKSVISINPISPKTIKIITWQIATIKLLQAISVHLQESSSHHHT